MKRMTELMNSIRLDRVKCIIGIKALVIPRTQEHSHSHPHLHPQIVKFSNTTNGGMFNPNSEKRK